MTALLDVRLDWTNQLVNSIATYMVAMIKMTWNQL